MWRTCKPDSACLSTAWTWPPVSACPWVMWRTWTGRDCLPLPAQGLHSELGFLLLPPKELHGGLGFLIPPAWARGYLCTGIMVMLATPLHGHVHGLNCNMVMLANPCRNMCMGSTSTWWCWPTYAGTCVWTQIHPLQEQGGGAHLHATWWCWLTPAGTRRRSSTATWWWWSTPAWLGGGAQLQQYSGMQEISWSELGAKTTKVFGSRFFCPGSLRVNPEWAMDQFGGF